MLLLQYFHTSIARVQKIIAHHYSIGEDFTRMNYCSSATPHRPPRQQKQQSRQFAHGGSRRQSPAAYNFQ